MLAVEFVRWWYLEGLRQLVQAIWMRLRQITQIFSLPILLRTLFAPWRRIVSYNEGTLQDRLRAMLDNLISRLVGGSVRVVVIVVAILSMTVVAVVGAALVLLWPLAPVVGIGLIIWGLLP